MLPAVQFLQKSIQRHLDDVSRLYVLPWAGQGGAEGTAALGGGPIPSWFPTVGLEVPASGVARS